MLLGALVLGTASLAFSAYNTQASLLINAFVIVSEDYHCGRDRLSCSGIHRASCLSLLLQYEAVVGIYFAAMGTIRAKFVPEGQRATIMNVMR